MRARWLRWGGALVAASVAFFAAVSAGSASSDSLTLSVSATPTDAGFTITAGGVATDPGETVYVEYRGAGGGSQCPGSRGNLTPLSPDGRTSIGPGQFTVTGTSVTLPAGSYQLWWWLFDPAANSGQGAYTVTQPQSLTVAPADTLSLAADAGPVEGRGFNVTARGTSYDPNALLDATYKPAAGGGCAASPAADSGTVASTGAGAGVGTYSAAVLINQVLDRGSYLVCSWLVDGALAAGSQVLAAASATVTVRPVSATLQIHVPAKVDPGQPFSLSLSANLDHGVPVRAIADLLPLGKGASCASAPSGEPTSAAPEIDTQLTDTQVPTGSVSSSRANLNAPQSGTAVVCAWLEAGWTSLQTAPVVSGPVSATIAVARDQVYRGNTSQHHRIVITVGPVENAIVGISVSAHLHCAGRATLPSGLSWNGLSSSVFDPQTIGRVRFGRAGTFRIDLSGNANHTFKISGRLSKQRITGTFAERGRSFVFTDNNAQNLGCSTGTVRFSARR